MTDRIRLHGIRVRGHHGVHDHERRDGQDFLIDVDLDMDLRAAAASDQLADTIDYAALVMRLGVVVAGEPVALIERLAEQLAQVCLADARVTRAEVTVHKPDVVLVESVRDVSVTVVRP
ncbi:MAG TPA: dihydroneopterin aldolase [Mycobacteriales bacterium]|nr:dihydroneopterin aldolase [Mycobacteriales bacterium]